MIRIDDQTPADRALRDVMLVVIFRRKRIVMIAGNFAPAPFALVDARVRDFFARFVDDIIRCPVALIQNTGVFVPSHIRDPFREVWRTAEGLTNCSQAPCVLLLRESFRAPSTKGFARDPRT